MVVVVLVLVGMVVVVAVIVAMLITPSCRSWQSNPRDELMAFTIPTVTTTTTTITTTTIDITTTATITTAIATTITFNNTINIADDEGMMLVGGAFGVGILALAYHLVVASL